MSTKAIREVLSDARASAVEWGMQNTVPGIDAAMAEVEAIEGGPHLVRSCRRRGIVASERCLCAV